jgi:hypothetical protein
MTPPFRIKAMLIPGIMLLAASLAMAGACHAQVDEDLVPGFAKLSAKERTRLAEQERAEALRDTAYQAVMASAESAFREKRYHDALALYEDARARRPLNVYPKVKIQDIRALIAREQEEERQAGKAADDRKEVGEKTTSTIAPWPAVVRSDTAAAPRWEKPTMPVTHSHPGERKAVPPAPIQPQPSPEPPAGERIYREGRAVVMERHAIIDGRQVQFRKVCHPWGETVYFQDGLAVHQRVWDAVFGGR